MITPIIMAGGSGTRLWPASRKFLPKQFLDLISDSSMLQDTFARLGGLECDRAIVITNEDQRFLAAEQIRQKGYAAEIILEPLGRNTAPAIALAAIRALQTTPDAILMVLASDHVIQNVGAFHQCVTIAQPLAESGELVTFGIVPTEASTGYGYIRKSAETVDFSGSCKVAQFVEKPNLETAQSYLDSGDYLWNSGMFMFRADRYLEELKAHRPDIADACAKAAKFEGDLDFLRVEADIFNRCPEDSIDYAVMEKTDRAVVVPMDAGWSDVGSWSSLWDVLDKDANGNVSHGRTLLNQTKNSLVFGDERLIATLGVEDLIVVNTKDALLVAHKDAIQDVKQIVKQVEKDGGSEHEFHRVVYRPWGHYDSVDEGDRFKVKRITVKPGEKLSVQMHHHRAEHWVVVTGTAMVTKDDETVMLRENESIYLPIGCVHALENPGKTPLELIEVQVGGYLGEDDIVRFEDRYGRIRK